MKNIRNIAFYFILLAAVGLRDIQASKELAITAKQLTQISYTSQQMQQHVVLFIHNNENIVINKNQQLPTAEDILAKVSQLQDANGIIQDEKLKRQALNALNATLKATKKAILVANLQHEHAQLIEILIDQKIALESKITQLNQKSLWLFLSKPSTKRLLMAAAVIIVATGIAHCYYKLNSDDFLNEKIPNLTPEDLMKPVYKELQKSVSDFFDSNNKQDILVYAQIAKNLKPELDPIKDKDRIELLDILIAAPNQANVGNSIWFPSAEQKANRKHWLNIYSKKDHYNNIAASCMNTDPKNINITRTFYNRMKWQFS